MKPKKKTILHADTPCLCGSGKTIRACHLGFDGRLRIARPNLHPPRPKTGHSHPKCYLQGTHDCSPEISGEHYISKAVLEQLGDKIKISGAPWMKPGETLVTTPENLIANILCRRHNEALSPLDVEAGKFFSKLTNALADLERKTLSRKPTFHMVSGEALELWMLKVSCGIYYSVGATNGKRIAETHSIDLDKVQRALFDGKWDDQAGLYLKASEGNIIVIDHNVDVAPLTTDDPSIFSGIAMWIKGFRLELIFDSKNANLGHWKGLTKQLSELVLTEKERSHHIIFTWPPGTPEKSVGTVGIPRKTKQTS
jgi:hypothetical protein